MKKLKLSELNLGDAEVLSRKELKKVLGGMGSGGSGGGSGAGYEEWLCSCVDGLYPDHCQVQVGVGEGQKKFDDCCGFTGPVLSPEANSYISFCQ